jgi:hypothetical protein
MWRFILISFGFLGFAFYELSGGADYAPAPNSLQVAWADKPFFAVPAPVQKQDLQLAASPAVKGVEVAQSHTAAPLAEAKAAISALKSTETDEKIARTQTMLASLGSDDFTLFNVTLAGASQGLVVPQNASLGLSGMGTFNTDNLVQAVRAVPLAQAVPPKPADIRSVTGTNVNMRAGPGTDFEAVDQLNHGAPVQVLNEAGGWVRLRNLETGQIGWMADWLVTASN